MLPIPLIHLYLALCLDVILLEGGKVEGEGEAQRVFQRVMLVNSEKVGHIQSEDAVVDTCPHGDELAVAFGGVLKEVAGTHEQKVAVTVLQADRPVYFVEFLQSTARCIVK